GVRASEPLSRAPEAGVNLIEDQQRRVLVAKAAQQRQKLGRGNVDAAPSLNRLDQDCADGLAAQQTLDCLAHRRQFLRPGGKGREAAKLAELAAEMRAEML